MKKVIYGTVFDSVSDCGHLQIWDEKGDDYSILNEALKEFEGKKVKITIEKKKK